ncbi:FecR domain-containing protein [Pedobacter sp. PAMC26386]|nr:FecR domain-containing protein [Pedobacter sp. PAMC26386]
MKKKIDAELLDRYLDGNCTDQESVAVNAWLLAKGNQKERHHVNSIWTLIKPEKKRRKLLAIAIAASFLILMGMGFFFQNRWNKEFGYPAQEELLTVETKSGSRKVLTLSDGTIIRLNANSKIIYPKHFTDSSRKISLSGEAYFEVSKDAKRPFEINSNHSHTTVLGTVFNLKDYAGEEKSALTLVNGRVLFAAKRTGKKVIITPNEQAVILSDGSLTKKEVYVDAYSGWKDSRLVFQHQSLKEIVTILERWYGIQITVKNTEILNNRCSGIYLNPSLNEVLKSLSFILHFQYQTNDKKVLIY